MDTDVSKWAFYSPGTAHSAGGARAPMSKLISDITILIFNLMFRRREIISSFNQTPSGALNIGFLIYYTIARVDVRPGVVELPRNRCWWFMCAKEQTKVYD